jgi:hypothetical protein
MHAQTVADKLAARKVSSVDVIEPTAAQPGWVQINDDIYVEIPFEGDTLYVVMRHPDGQYEVGRPRRRLGYVIDDISCARCQGSPRP